MKKVLLFTAAVLVGSVVFTSCQKSYVCDCTTIADTDYGKMKKGGITYTTAEASCTLQTVSDPTCKFTTK